MENNISKETLEKLAQAYLKELDCILKVLNS